MTNEKEILNATAPWSLTVGAVFAQISFVFSIAVEGQFLLPLLLAVIGAGLSLFAIGGWKMYFEAFVRREVQARPKVDQVVEADA